MEPEFPDLTKCKKCNTIIWLRKQKEIGNYRWGDEVDLKFQTAEEVEFLEIEDQFRALDLGMAENKGEEIFIRTRIWFSYNDRLRIPKYMHERLKKGISMFIDENDELNWKKNCTELISLLDQSNLFEKLMLAELHRNLGNFEDCITILNSIDHDGLKSLKEKFILECQLKNRYNVRM